jgi:hypothetical protein
MLNYKNYIILLVYFGFSFLLKETHPFSRFPMYNQFPNWSYVFYLSDEYKNLIPSKTNFNITGGWIGHTFYALCHDKGIKYGDNTESKEDLAFIGEKMFNQITQNNKILLKELSTIHLHKISFYIENDSIIKKDEVIYEYYNR